ncbi:ketopantoate reductase family protein [Bacillus sp. B15-48]|uniref:ketopantoate reductase family protein n=1 Tax=Bacillus sp. B15-48 TaxID=1548601 RepID=UPI00193F414E|nr:ketopantoate reductase family protein [Bacillus sp. B15-48]MBM4761862.1 2-dehydropantoate 2-reductase [Bacillus sp. B15-48]
MNILVQGAGALGSYFGGRMLEAGENVSFFVREKRANQLRDEGLKIVSPEGNFECKNVNVFTQTDEVENVDVIVLTVKGYHLDQVIPQVETIVHQTGAYVLPLLNGMEHLEKLQKAVGKEKVIGGFASIIATLNEQGHVVHTSGSSALKFGSLHPEQTDVCDKFEDLHKRVKTNLLKEENILKHMWKKYIFITAFSGVTSATQLPAGFIANVEATFEVAKKVIYEMSMLAEKEGIELTNQEIENMVKRLKKFPEEATSSMHQDLRKGLPIEVEHFHGGALRLARKHEVTIPVIETLYGVLKPYEHGKPYEVRK